MELVGRNLVLRRLAEEYTEVLKSLLGESLVSVVLYGSVARGEATPLSDIDLLVIAEGLPHGRFARRERLLAADDWLTARLGDLRRQGLTTDIYPVLKTPAEAAPLRPFYLDMVEDAVMLYDKGGFFAKVLADLRASLDRLGSRRLQRGRVRYWDLKPDYRPGEIFSL